MAEPAIFAFKGASSQTGQATLAEFPSAKLEPGFPTLDNIINAVKLPENLGVLPLWNSHVGEIKEVKALELLFQGSAKLLRLFPSTIKFECLVKTKPDQLKKKGEIISVHVAEIQCSEFISTNAFHFNPADSTVDAYNKFHDSNKFDAALCTPGQNKHGYFVLDENTSNPLNFTTFAVLGASKAQDWTTDRRGEWFARLFPTSGVFFATEMPISTISLSEAQQQLLTDLSTDAKTVDDIPKVVFVSRRKEDTCGLLFEADGIGFDGNIITESGYSTRVNVIPDIGSYNKKYSQRAYEYLFKEHRKVLKHDFLRHIGKKTCFFACPALGIITHGFEQNIVEPVVKRILVKYFELYVNGLGCSVRQRKFFERYKASYLEEGSKFIKFQDVGI